MQFITKLEILYHVLVLFVYLFLFVGECLFVWFDLFFQRDLVNICELIARNICFEYAFMKKGNDHISSLPVSIQGQTYTGRLTVLIRNLLWEFFCH